MPSNEIEPFAVKRAEACELMRCGRSKLLALEDAGEVEAFLDGGVVMITVRSIRARQARLLRAGRDRKRRSMLGRTERGS
jgi:hypothetical protein